MRISIHALTTCAAAAFISVLPAAAEDAAKVAELFQEVGDHLKAQNAFTITLDLDYDLKMGDVTEDITTDYTIKFRRPDHISAVLENETVQAHFISTGDETTTYISEFNGYTVDDEATPPSDLIAQSAYGVLTNGMFMLAELVKEEPFVGLLENATDVQLVEEHHARFTHEDVQWDVWFEKNDGKLLIDRFSPDLTPMLQESNEAGEDSSIDLVYDFTEWSFEEIGDDAFALAAPEGIEEVASFRPPSPADALLGKPAPDFTLALMDGGELTLSEKADDAVYILDFWATWCGPCRQAMPILEKVANDFADKNVKLFAVNLEESAEEITPFLENNGLDISVALDKDGAVSELYQVTGIPQTVIVGKDGTVQVVHIGVSPSLENELRDELTKLVEGEKLASN